MTQQTLFHAALERSKSAFSAAAAQNPLLAPLGAVLEPLEPAPDPRGATWRAYTLDHDRGAAAAAFQQRYGRPPRFVFEHLGLLLVGPVPGLEGGV